MSQDSITQYFADMGAFGLLDKQGEVAAFLMLEKVEKQLVSYLLTSPSIRKTLSVLLSGLQEDKEVDSEQVRAVQAAIHTARGKDCTEAFMRAITSARLTPSAPKSTRTVKRCRVGFDQAGVSATRTRLA